MPLASNRRARHPPPCRRKSRPRTQAHYGERESGAEEDQKNLEEEEEWEECSDEEFDKEEEEEEKHEA